VGGGLNLFELICSIVMMDCSREFYHLIKKDKSSIVKNNLSGRKFEKF